LHVLKVEKSEEMGSFAPGIEWNRYIFDKATILHSAQLSTESYPDPSDSHQTGDGGDGGADQASRLRRPTARD
jgi:hypothetical protein